MNVYSAAPAQARIYKAYTHVYTHYIRAHTQARGATPELRRVACRRHRIRRRVCRQALFPTPTQTDRQTQTVTHKPRKYGILGAYSA